VEETSEPEPSAPDPVTQPTPTSEPDTKCATGGCSGELCAAAGSPATTGGLATPCVFLPEHQCRKDHGTCEVQSNGQCGWTETPALKACMDKAKKSQPKK
jgi:hypothetical protein